MCKRIKALPATASMIHAKSFMSTFGLEDINSQHTTVMAQRYELTPVLGQIDMLEGKQVWNTQIKIMAKIMAIAERAPTADNSENPALSEPGKIHVLAQDKIAIQQKDVTG